MGASFEEKVEALKRLRERRLARASEADAALAAAEGDVAAETQAADSTQVQSASEIGSAEVARKQVEPPMEAEQNASDTTPRCDGNADVLFCTGHCYERGIHGFPQDMVKAEKSYRGAAEAGHTVAQWRLGELLELGRGGVARDEAEAAKWYTCASEDGHMHAQSCLALLLEGGRGVAVNEDSAFHWHVKAAESGHALSQYCAARCLIRRSALACSCARTSAENAAKAQHWMRLSAAAGFPPAVAALAVADDGDEVSNADIDSMILANEEKSLDNDCDDTAGTLAQSLARAVEDLSVRRSAAILADNIQGGGYPSHAAVASDTVGNRDANDRGFAHGSNIASPMMALAVRVAEQLKELSDAEAEELLDELLVDAPVELFFDAAHDVDSGRRADAAAATSSDDGPSDAE
eukprot:TRINITY_DN46325_c0_g1_i1.p1 TRINITY_DN46325_c0_g1~~TRINITY_DN46325_c0_g1_i1.p1  ORF type:complete len:408 (+),score=99.19 TRINITY_DN46325_c0_g1_i1:118-1341(+)